MSELVATIWLSELALWLFACGDPANPLSMPLTRERLLHDCQHASIP